MDLEQRFRLQYWNFVIVGIRITLTVLIAWWWIINALMIFVIGDYPGGPSS
jgi:hypothetical protein